MVKVKGAYYDATVAEVHADSREYTVSWKDRPVADRRRPFRDVTAPRNASKPTPHVGGKRKAETAAAPARAPKLMATKGVAKSKLTNPRKK